ncbi:MAG TPA: hypothetical protein VNF04_18235 [Stellaceae bacterium]|nr:hypothetical protein [Stellaceae bacterium]
MGEVAGLEALGAGLQSAGANMQSAGAGWGATAAAVAANPPPSAPDIPLTPLHLYTPPPPPADYPSAGIGAAAAGALSPTGGWVSNPLNPPP